MEGDPHAEGPMEAAANHPNSDISTVLQAVAENRPDVLKNLIEEGEPIDKKDHDGRTALHFAALNGHTECVRLLTNEVSIHDQDADGKTALHYAAFNGHTECVRLLTNEVLIHDQGADGLTALHVAAYIGYTECVRVLLNEESSDIDVRTNNWETPLMLATLRAHKECIKILIERGANTKISNKCGETALHRALYKEQPDLEVVKWLVQGRDNPPTLRQLARNEIRFQLADCDKFCTRNIQKLDLPETVKEYLRLTDLEDGSEEQKLMKKVSEILF